MKTKCWAKGGRQEGQYPDWFKGKKGHNTVKTITETPIVWTYGSNKSLEMWIADSAATVLLAPTEKTSPLTKSMTSVESSKPLETI